MTPVLEHALINQGLFTPEEFGEFRRMAQENGDSVSSFLVKSNKIEEHVLLPMLAEVYQLEYVASIPREQINYELLRKFSIRYLKQNLVLPLLDGNDDLVVACSSVTGFELMQDFAFVLGREPKRMVLTTSEAILSAINYIFGSIAEEDNIAFEELDSQDASQSLDDGEIKDLLDDTSDAPFIKYVNKVLTQAVRANASDIHIEPFHDMLRIRFRLDGVLYDKHAIPRRHHAAIISRIKIMANLNIAEKRLPQDGRIALSMGGRMVDLRVSCLPTSYGERVVLRLLEKSNRILSMRELGLADTDLEMLKRLVTISHGIILVTGPTGSGKTTTLYSVLSYINSSDKNILTIEDPVEYQLDGVGQMQVNQKIDLTFAKGLRSIVRQDPDVILIGEIRDRETADIAIQAALTGHLVFSTLHTNDAPSALTRLIDMGVEPFLLASVLRAVVAQRLVRILCPHCKEPYPADQIVGSEFPNCPEIVGSTVYRPQGCDHCLDTGYSGRKAIYEIMNISDAVKSLMLKTADSNQLAAQALADGMKTLKDDGCHKVLQGLTSVTEVLRVTNL